MPVKFELRPDIPHGFRENPVYAELPMAVKFLGQYDGKEFKTREEFEQTISTFPEYLIQNKVPRSTDAGLRAGLFLERVKGMEALFDVFTRSDENSSGSCWFGSLGSGADLKKYFEAQKQAREAQIRENDDEM